MMNEYLIKYSYWQDGRRRKEQDVFWGDTTQEAVDTCRSENLYYFSECFGRIEEVYKDCGDCWADYNDEWE